VHDTAWFTPRAPKRPEVHNAQAGQAETDA